MSAGSRNTLVAVVLLAALGALAFVAACAMTHGPGQEYRDHTSAMDAPALYRERLALVQQLRTLDAERARLTPESTAEAEALGVKRTLLAAKLTHVNELLAQGEFPVHDLRYKLDAPTLEPSPETLAQQMADASEQHQPTKHQPQDSPAAKSSPPAPEVQTATSADTSNQPTAQAEQPRQPAPPVQGPATVTAVRWADSANGLVVSIDVSSHATPRCRVFSLEAPLRHVVDVLNVTEPPTALPALIAVDSPMAQRIRIGWHPDNRFIRIVIDAAEGTVSSQPASVPGHAVFTVSR